MVDWSKFKSEAKGLILLKSKKAYIELCELLNKNNHKLLSEYINNSTKVLVDFNCGHESHWTTPNRYKKGIGCPKCSKYHSEQGKESLIDLINKSNHKLLSEYINSSTKVLINFNCGHEPHWVRPNDYKRGVLCPKCKRVCLEQAKEDFLDILKTNNHKILSEYVNRDTKVLIDFDCGHEPHWIRPHTYKKGIRCPKCSCNCPKQARKVFLNKLKENNHALLSEYINSTTKVLIDFNCGHQPHLTTPINYRQGKGCPKCRNKGEAELYKLLISMGYKVKTEKTYNNLKHKGYLRYDFYLPKYNLLIELDGDHHRNKIIYKTDDMTELEKYLEEIKACERLKDRQYKDGLKNDYAKDNDIPLLRIEYSKGKIELDIWKKLIEYKIKEITLKNIQT